MANHIHTYTRHVHTYIQNFDAFSTPQRDCGSVQGPIPCKFRRAHFSQRENSCFASSSGTHCIEVCCASCEHAISVAIFLDLYHHRRGHVCASWAPGAALTIKRYMLVQKRDTSQDNTASVCRCNTWNSLAWFISKCM